MKMKGKTRSQSQSSHNSVKLGSVGSPTTEDEKHGHESPAPVEKIERGSPSESDHSESPSATAPISSHQGSGTSQHSSPPLTPGAVTPSGVTTRRSSSHGHGHYVQGDGGHGGSGGHMSDESGASTSGETSYVTYVEQGSGDHSSIFVAAAATATASANGQTMSYPVYAVGEGAAMFGNGGTAQYYSSSNAITYAQDGGVAYLVPSAVNSNSNASTNMDSDSQPSLSHATRVSPATVQWLMDNYETAEGVSLPRSTLYYHYLRHCQEHKLDPVNAASFGKLIRSVFLGLRTRRLGTRGNSKYHYYGIRLKPSSPLNHFEEVEHQHHNSNGHSASTTAVTATTNASTPPVNGSRHSVVPSTSPAGNNSNHAPSASKKAKLLKSEPGELANGLSTADTAAVQQYMGDPSNALEEFPDLNFGVPLPEGLIPNDVLLFHSLYREHCELLLEDIVNFQLADVDKRWKTFWRTGESQGAEAQPYDNIISRSKLQLLCATEEVQHFVRDADYLFYQSIVSILLPDVLRPIPSTMTQAIRNFAKGLEGNLATAMVGLPDDMITTKVTIVNSLAQTLRRYTSLNHLAQAARAVLQNQTQINQMLTDLNRVDFHNVEEQAAWVCGCDGDLVPDLEADFKATLSQQQSLEQWAHWLEGVVNRILRPHLNSGNFLKVARNFLLKWSFYSSLIIRDLTLRSAASFGSFHLLRLLYDEYMFYLVEQKVAEVTGTVPIAVIGKRSLENNLPSTGASATALDAEDSHTQALVDRYIKDRQLNQTSSDLQSAAAASHPSNGNGNGMNGGSISDESSGDGHHSGAATAEAHQASNHAQAHTPKTEIKQRKKNFLVV